jgi:hypothetical protein
MEILTLHHNRPLRVAGTPVVECLDGCVWITSAAGAGDVFLRAGERHRLAGGLSLVEALGMARVRVLSAPSRRRRLLSAVLSSSHEFMRAVRHPGRRHPLAG